MKLKIKKEILLIVTIFILAFLLRIWSVYPNNTIVGFDQVRDFFDSRVIIFDSHLRIVGPTAGNNPNLHHGVLFLYYLLPSLFLLGGNPMWAVVWNCLFNSLAVVVIFYLSKSLFNSTKAAIASALIAAVSYQFVNFAGWLSNPTVTLLTVPLFFWGVWNYYKGKKYALPITAFALGLSIQFELFFIYLTPIGIILWIVLKPKLPSIKLFLISIGILLLTLSTMILTEIKYNFAGVGAILGAGSKVGGVPFEHTLTEFFHRFWQTFALNLFPQGLDLGPFLGNIIILVLIVYLIKTKENTYKKALLFLIIYLFSPAIMLFLGYHNAPWFLIGLPPAIAIAGGFVVSKIQLPSLFFLIVVVIMMSNIFSINDSLGKGQLLLSPDPSSLLSSQVAAIDYIYASSSGDKFTINSLTNPLYVNAIWDYNFSWYGRGKYGFLPSWSGGDQIHPYDNLQKPTGEEKYLYLLIDRSSRIPPVYKENLIEWANEKSVLEEEKYFGGILVQKRALR